MRIQILVDCYLPNPKSSAKLVHDLAIEFCGRGHDVRIIAPDDSIAEPRSVSRDGRLTVVRVRSGMIKGASKVRRAINEARLSSLIWSRCRDLFANEPSDLVVYYSPTIFFGSLVNRLKKQWNCPSYLILRDIFPQWAVDAGVLRKGLPYYFFRMKEIQQYAAADVIGVQSPANLDYFRDNGWSNRHEFDVLYNWTTLDAPACSPTNYRERWGLQEKIVFFYGGNIGVAQDMDNVLRLAGKLRDEPRAHFLLVGDGSEVPRLKAKIQTDNLANVSIKPPVGQVEYDAMLREFDVGLITLERNLKTQNLPGKMLGYMASSMPMLASINPGNDLRSILEERNAGLACWNGEDDTFAGHARRLAHDAVLRRRIGENGRKLLEEKFLVSNAAAQITSRWTRDEQVGRKLRPAA